MTDALELGKRGEALAWNFLRKRGCSILEKNFRTRFGEIDVIAQREGTVIFIEVKTRRNENFGAPSEAVDWRKRQRLARAAEAFLQTRNLEDRPTRFDILSVIWDGAGEPQFSILEDAFSLEEA